MTRQERKVVGYTASAHALAHGLEWTYAAILPVLSEEFGVGPLFLGVVANFSAFLFGFAALPAGFLSDRMGSKNMLVICLASAGVMAVVVALSPTVYVFAVAFTVLGFAIGLYHPIGVSFITRGVRQRARGLGYHGMAGNMGVALAPALAGWLVAEASWRAAFALLAVVTLGIAIMVWRSSIDEGEGSSGGENHDPREASVPWRTLKPFMVPLLTIFLINVVGGFVYRGSLTFLPTHIKDQLGVSLFNLEPVTLAGYMTTIALLFGVVGQFVGGQVGERFKRERTLPILWALFLGPLLLIGMAHGVLLIATAAAFVCIFFMAQPIANALVADYTPVAFQGRSYGIMFFSNFGLGSFAGTYAGYVIQQFGTSWVFYTLAGFAVVGLLISLCLLLGGFAKVGPAVSAAEEGA
jgi:MFS family permease